jgi:hypothetical protein
LLAACVRAAVPADKRACLRRCCRMGRDHLLCDHLCVCARARPHCCFCGGAAEAKAAGFVAEVVAPDQLLPRAQALGEQWAAEGRVRNLVAQGRVQEYLAVNEKESLALAHAFLDTPFLDGQYRFLKSKGKTQLAAMFWVLKTTRPLWSKLL